MKFQVIYLDAPWHFKTYSEKGRGRSPKYQTMSLDEIKAMNIKSLAAETGCVMFSWVTMPFLEKGIEAINAWGFKYKTVAFTWIKTNKDESLFMGQGYYTRSNAELCLLATRGPTVQRHSRSVHSVIMAPRGPHSEKPQEAADRIRELFPYGPRVELFARKQTPGFWPIGNEITGNDINEDIKILADLAPF